MQNKRDVIHFYLLVFALSVPFWGFAALAPGLSRFMPMRLPVSAFMFLCPVIAAGILTWRRQGLSAAGTLLKRVFDGKYISHKRWLLVIIAFMPLVLAAAYGVDTLRAGSGHSLSIQWLS